VTQKRSVLVFGEGVKIIGDGKRGEKIEKSPKTKKEKTRKKLNFHLPWWPRGPKEERIGFWGKGKLSMTPKGEKK
jgi:hypothetical protein